jgi:hypothetical protein
VVVLLGMENKLIKIIILYCSYLFVIGCASQKVQHQPAEPKFFVNYRLLKPGMSSDEINYLLGDIEKYASRHKQRMENFVHQRILINGQKQISDITLPNGQRVDNTTLFFSWLDSSRPLEAKSFSLTLSLYDNKLRLVRIGGTHWNGLQNPPTYQSEATRGSDYKVIFDKTNDYITSLMPKNSSVVPSHGNKSYDEAKKELLQQYMKKEITKEEYFQIFKEIKASYDK